MHKFIIWLCFAPTDKIIKLKSWWPSLGERGLEWPVVLIDNGCGRRSTQTPIWDRAMIRHVLGLGRAS